MLQKLLAVGVRAEIDDRNEKVGKKIRDTELLKVPYMLVIGEKEMNENAVAVRKQGIGDVGVQQIDEFVVSLQQEISERR